MSDLKPCPFCGSPAYSYHDNCIDFAGVKCDLGGCVCADILITENNWNTRPIEDDLRKRIAELEAESERFTVHSDIERQDDKSPNDTQTQTIVYGKWIPVSERLPEVYRDGDGEFIPFLVCENDKDYPYRAIYDGLNWGDGMFVADVTHWMPLPELPEVQE